MRMTEAVVDTVADTTSRAIEREAPHSRPRRAQVFVHSACVDTECTLSVVLDYIPPTDEGASIVDAVQKALHSSSADFPKDSQVTVEEVCDVTNSAIKAEARRGIQVRFTVRPHRAPPVPLFDPEPAPPPTIDCTFREVEPQEDEDEDELLYNSRPMTPPPPKSRSGRACGNVLALCYVLFVAVTTTLLVDFLL